MSRRMSFGGSALRDVSSLQNARSSSVSRRMSITSSDFRSATPAKDRRAMLDDWRRQQKAEEEEKVHKRAKLQPPLPPSSSTTPGSDSAASGGTTALERYRMRKNQRMNEALQDNMMDFRDASIQGLQSVATPSHSNASARRRSMSIAPLHRGFPPLAPSQDSQHSLSQLTQDDGVVVEMDSVEGASLRSRLREMKQRIDQLEQEKMVLSMSKAPLEARFRQKEDEWEKETNRLLDEIDTLRDSSRSADDRYRDLVLKHEALQEECKHLRHQVLKASSSRNTGYENRVADSGWSQLVQNDRDMLDLKEKLRDAEEEIDSLRLAKVSVEKELHAFKIELSSALRSLDELQHEFDELHRSKTENRDAEIKLEVLQIEHIATSAQLNAVCSDLAATKARSEVAMSEKDAEHKRQLEDMQFEMSVLKTRAAKVVDDSQDQSLFEVEDDAVLKARIEERDRRIAELEEQLLSSEQQRRKMHNCIQELRGNIRVYVRTRPFLPNDQTIEEPAIDVSPDGESLTILDQRNGATHDFKFDKVFPPSAGQDNVFQEVADFVQSALDGYNVCLFSYGQTGSGKTHTMQGSGNAAMRGIIPRAVEQILTQAKVMQNQKWTFNLSASFLEIYNEEIKDLLVQMSESRHPDSHKLKIKRSREGKSYVDGLTEVPIETRDSGTGMQQLDALMSVAARTRSVASTKMNAQSSRSHSVFMLHLRGINSDSGAVVEGTLNLCDLAGSERLDRSGADSDAQRLRETQAINKSLSCLGDVFNALAQRASHIPYRNSTLTYLLQDCLSGDGKALMFVNLSPTSASSNESLCSLRFAQRVNQVELGKPTKNIQYNKSRKLK